MKKDDYIEPEIIKKNSGEEYNEIDNVDIENYINKIKKTIILKGLSVLIFPIIVFILIISLISWLIMYVIDTHPYDYIVTGIFLFLVLSPIYKLIRIFK